MKSSDSFLEELLRSQDDLRDMLSDLERDLQSPIREELKNLSSLEKMGMKSVQTMNEKYLGSVTLELEKRVKEIRGLPVGQFKAVAGRLFDVMLEHVGQKVLEVRQFTRDDIDAVDKFLKQLTEYAEAKFDSFSPKAAKREGTEIAEYAASWNRINAMEFILGAEGVATIEKQCGMVPGKTLPFVEVESLVRSRFESSPELQIALAAIKERLSS